MTDRKPAAVDYCTVHEGIRNEDAYYCDFAEDDEKDRECELHECFYRDPEPVPVSEFAEPHKWVG